MKMSLMIVLASAILSMPAFAADETCYQVSTTENAWSRTPERLCVERVGGSRQVEITLKTGLPMMERTIAKFDLSLLRSARCPDCNGNVYGVALPANSVFNALSIRFNGTRDPQTGDERGTVEIGANRFFYKLNR